MKHDATEKLCHFGYSYVGKRANNEDNFEILQLNSNSYFMAVADGMGGYEGGETASQLTMEAALEILGNITEKITIQAGKNLLGEIFLTADKKIAAAKKQWPELSSMGTTLTCLLVIGDQYIWGNIGDSRIYLIHKNHIHQITKDHTYLEHFGGKNKENLPKKVREQYGNTLTKALDGSLQTPDIYPLNEDSMRLKPGQAFLLCSDGLITDTTEDKPNRLLETVHRAADLQAAAHKLIDQAYQDGSSDNITVLLAAYGKIPKKKYPRSILWIGLILVSLFIGLFSYQKKMDPPPEKEMIQNRGKPFIAPNPKQVLKLEDIKWHNPLEEYASSLKRTDPISWESFPKKEILKHYQLELIEKNQSIEIIETEQSFIQLDQFKNLKNKTYTLRLSAVTSLGTITAEETEIKVIQ